MIKQSPPRRLRADAARNREKILDAAAEVFAERGFEATMHDVAARAGIGPGTVYRRFADKTALIDALFDDRVNELVGLAEAAVERPDAGAALIELLTAVAGHQAHDLGLQEILNGGAAGFARIDATRQRMYPHLAALLRRAQAEGAVRADLRPTDLPLILLMVGAVSRLVGKVSPELWQRYLGFVLHGIRTEAVEGTPAAPSLEQLLGAMRDYATTAGSATETTTSAPPRPGSTS